MLSPAYGRVCNVGEQIVLHVNREQKRYLPVIRATSCTKISVLNATQEQTRRENLRKSRRELRLCMLERQVERSLKGAKNIGEERGL